MQPPDFGREPEQYGELLSRSEERFRLLVENVKDYAIFMLDADGRIVTWNVGAKRIKGYDAEEIVGKHFSVLYTDADVERGHPDHELRVAAADGSYTEEGERLRKDGSLFWADVTITALRDGRGELRGFAKVTRDVTSRKEAEERERLLTHEQAALRRATDILESISDAFFAVDDEWRFTYVNQRAGELLGRSRGELLGKDIWQQFPLVKGSEAYRRIRRAHEGGMVVEFESDSLSPGAWISGRAYPSRDGLSVYFRDTTERRRAEVERARLAAIVESSDDVIIGKTLDGIITSWNRGAEKIYGYSAEEAVGRSVSMLVPPERPNEIPDILERVRRGIKVDHFETVRMTKQGERLGISLTVSPVRDAAGKIVGASTIARDISERKRADEVMREAREVERRRIARDLHDGMLQDLSYAVQAMEVTRLRAEGTGLEEDLREEVEAIRGAARGLRAAVHDLRLADELDQPFPRLVASLVARSHEMAHDQQVRLEVREGFSSKPLGETGTELLRIVREALTNARRHSGARNVVVTLMVEGDESVVEVSDDGRGFGPETSPGVGSRSMKERAAVLGGRLEIHSKPGEGTTVRLRTPTLRS